DSDIRQGADGRRNITRLVHDYLVVCEWNRADGLIEHAERGEVAVAWNRQEDLVRFRIDAGALYSRGATGHEGSDHRRRSPRIDSLNCGPAKVDKIDNSGPAAPGRDHGPIQTGVDRNPGCGARTVRGWISAELQQGARRRG